ncbi:response regulator [Clostridium chromiireducens]|uniref:Stage 0 sporulation protein A homolog n=1 Tax=Clostridium chromiireducens TaxID=225345 RepID=A0A964RPE0_9CLOT|nr:response regulator transcription factor [Clostridium chromiireducens]MVX65594.1 response regulator [Clostridium chromiireducens]
MNYNIYLVEDEENLNHILKSYLEKDGFNVTSFFNGETARAAIEVNPHLWILDIMLPDIDGYQLIKEIKENNKQTPVIFISARDADLDRVIGLELGSDDYIAKPFLPRELVIRTKKLIERVYGQEVERDVLIISQICGYTIDEKKRIVKSGEETISLTSKEFDILMLFVKNQLIAFSREQILHNIWGDEYFGSDRVVDDLIRRLRKRMPNLRIETVYGYGYRMVKE